MSSFYLILNTDNAAFAEDDAEEVARILEKAAETLRCHYGSSRQITTTEQLCDLNGATVGKFVIQPRDTPVDIPRSALYQPLEELIEELVTLPPGTTFNRNVARKSLLKSPQK